MAAAYSTASAMFIPVDLASASLVGGIEGDAPAVRAGARVQVAAVPGRGGTGCRGRGGRTRPGWWRLSRQMKWEGAGVAVAVAGGATAACSPAASTRRWWCPARSSGRRRPGRSFPPRWRHRLPASGARSPPPFPARNGMKGRTGACRSSRTSGASGPEVILRMGKGEWAIKDFDCRLPFGRRVAIAGCGDPHRSSPPGPNAHHPGTWSCPPGRCPIPGRDQDSFGPVRAQGRRAAVPGALISPRRPGIGMWSRERNIEAKANCAYLLTFPCRSLDGSGAPAISLHQRKEAHP